jgi:hypothetical protein
MNRFLPIIIFFILLQGCKPGIPKEIIQPSEMEKILFDIHLVDGYITTITNQDTAKIIASSYYNGIYKKYGIDSAFYNKSMNHYYSHPVILNEIYTNVEKAFTLETEKFNKNNINDAKNSLLIISNLPLVSLGPKIEFNPFDISLSSSRL